MSDNVKPKQNIAASAPEIFRRPDGSVFERLTYENGNTRESNLFAGDYPDAQLEPIAKPKPLKKG
jgi:hypothetical protein